MIAFENKVSKKFLIKTEKICQAIGIDTSDLMSCMAWESAGTFSPSIQNKDSYATGLIQFMRNTAIGLGTTIEELKNMTAVEQLDYVEKYFYPYRGKLKSLEDTYMAILYPKAIGESLNYILFRKNDPDYALRYVWNKGLDYNKDGEITKYEAATHVRELKEEWFKNNDLPHFDFKTEIRGLDKIK